MNNKAFSDLRKLSFVDLPGYESGGSTYTATDNECSEVFAVTKHKQIMVNYNLYSHLLLLAQLNQQSERGSACSICEETRNAKKKTFCGKMNKSYTPNNKHTGFRINRLFPSQDVSTFYKVIFRVTF
jgi:hypothetical protein